jgi:lincosamide nucleotidyltransferase A/C/D/E
MTACDAAGVIELLERQGLEVYVDGGWAADAVLGHETRPHSDLDIALPHKYVPRLREILGAQGYRERIRDDTWECNFVLADEHGRQVDVHSFTLDEAGNNVHGVPYRAEHFAWPGAINAYPVRCVTPEWQVKFHTGYKLDENDYRDVKALCERFGIALPDEYKAFAK